MFDLQRFETDFSCFSPCFKIVFLQRFETDFLVFLLVLRLCFQFTQAFKDLESLICKSSNDDY